MVFPGEKRMKRRLLRRIYKEKFLNLLRKLAGKPPKPYSWKTTDDSDLGTNRGLRRHDV